MIAGYASLGPELLAKMLGKTRQAVKWRAWYFGIPHTPQKGAPKWTQEDIEALKQQWEAGRLAALRAAFPERTESAIKTRVWEHIAPASRDAQTREDDRQRHKAYKALLNSATR
ncbi:hypothetical protein TK90_2754 (plasmid) [Thioalkalivibrio sp. K90mix]|nr:hypothetical protein TK90_2754 [Thioalkalivibrio sp. K90mix]